MSNDQMNQMATDLNALDTTEQQVASVVAGLRSEVASLQAAHPDLAPDLSRLESLTVSLEAVATPPSTSAPTDQTGETATPEGSPPVSVPQAPPVSPSDTGEQGVPPTTTPSEPSLTSTDQGTAPSA